MKKLTPQQAYRQIEKLEARIAALYELRNEIEERVPKQWRVGDRIRIRSGLGRIKYLQVTKVDTQNSHSEKSIREVLWGRTITKDGVPLSLVRLLRPAESDIANRIDPRAGK